MGEKATEASQVRRSLIKDNQQNIFNLKGIDTDIR
jgi:hypothetical protein